MMILRVMLLVTVVNAQQCADYDEDWPVPIMKQKYFRPERINSSDFARMCYYDSSASEQHPFVRLHPKDINATLCTHITYLSAGINDVHIHLKDSDETLYKELMKLREKNHDLKILLSVSTSPEIFSNMINQDSSTRAFATSAVNFLRANNFDGMELNWVLPDQEGGPSTDKPKHLKLMEEVRKAMDKESLGESPFLLVASFPGDRKTLKKYFCLRELQLYLDLFIVQAYNYHNYDDSDNTVGHPSALFRSKENRDQRPHLDVISTLDYFIHIANVDEQKLVLGIPTFGRTFYLPNRNEHYVGAPIAGPGDRFPFSNSFGFATYYEVCLERVNGGLDYELDDEHATYLLNDKLWIGFDSGYRVREKTCIARLMNLRGIALSSLSDDDTSGKFCDGGKFALHAAAKHELELKIPLMICSIPKYARVQQYSRDATTKRPIRYD